MRVTLLVAALLLPIAALAEQPWIDAGESDGTHVWYRDLTDKNARELRAETVMDVKPERVWEVISDIAHYPEFMPYLKEIRKLEECEGGYYLYEKVSPPVISTRDYTLKISIQADPAAGVWSRRWALVNDKGPALEKGVVRVTVNDGSFELRREGAGKTKFLYRLLTNPGGSVPLWIAKRASTSSLPDLIDGIRRRAIDPAWRR
jgi:hypothetical protein